MPLATNLIRTYTSQRAYEQDVTILAKLGYVVAVVIDAGPDCSVEAGVTHAILDTSGRIDRYLFGSDQGSSDRASIHVVEVDKSTPLGPQ